MAAYTTIDDPSAYFKVQLYTGNGSADRAITFDDTDTDMQPDAVWIKNRDGANNHLFQDAVRGATVSFETDGDGAEVSSSVRVLSFGSDGFSIGSAGTNNTNTHKYVSWNWKAGTTSGIGGSPDLTPSGYSFNDTSKFSIVAYESDGTTGDTIPHGLGVVPHFFLVKCRGAAGTAWVTYHHKNTSAPETDYLHLDTTDATADSVTRWNDTAPTSTLIALGSNSVVNQDDRTYVLYAWSSVQGYSKFGIYTGNGNVDAPFVYTGFRPAWIMIKGPTQTQSWIIVDTKRSPHNVVGNEELLADNLNAENSDTWDPNTDANILDFLSNGFKLRHTATTGSNTDATPYLYMAFAEAPFVNSNGVPCNAR